MSKVSEPWSSQQQCHLVFISEFTMDIQHIEGISNVVADCLSRATVQAVHLGMDFVRLTADQQSDQQSDPEVSPQATRIQWYLCNGSGQCLTRSMFLRKLVSSKFV